jgi:hypothetical protein
MPASIKISSLTEIPSAMTLEILPDNRLRLTRTYDIGKNGQVTETMFDPWGTPDVLAPDLVLVPPLNIEQRRETNSAGQINRLSVLTARYENLPAVPTETGSPTPVDLPGYYKTVTPVPTTGAMTINSPLLTVASNNNFCIGATVAVAGAVPTATIMAMDATGLVWTLSANATATVAGAAVTGSYTRFAREYTSQLAVAGIGSRDCWAVAKNAAYYPALPAGAVQRYFVGETVEQVGTVMAIITRKYCEQPDAKSHAEQINFTRPGSLGNNRTPSTIPVQVTVTRSYTLGLPTRSVLGYLPKAWAMETQQFHVAGDTGGNQFNQVEHAGYLSDGYGYVLLGGLNTFNGLVCDVVSVSATSDPATTPVGATIISSEPGREPWKGDIWEKTDVVLNWGQF